VSQKSLNDEERGGNCLLVPERSYGPGWGGACFRRQQRHCMLYSCVARFVSDSGVSCLYIVLISYCCI